MKRYLGAIVLIALSAGQTVSAAEVTFDKAMSNAVYWIKDFKQFRTSSIESHLKSLKIISKSADLSKCFDQNVSASCINIISRIVLESAEGYDQEPSSFLNDFKDLDLDVQQQEKLQRLRDALTLIEGKAQLVLPGQKSEQGHCSQQALEKAFEKAIPKVTPWTKSAAFNRVIVQSLICEGQLSVRDVSQVNNVLTKNFFENISAQVKLEQSNILKVDQLFPELK